MRSFASLAAFASIVFATVASALPTAGGYTSAVNGISISKREFAEVENTVTNNVNVVGFNDAIPSAQPHQARQVPGLPDAPGIGGAGAATGVIGTTVASLANGHTTRAEYRSLPDIIVELNVKIQSLCHDLSAAVSVAASASAALDVSIPILTEIKTHLVEAKAEIEVLVAAHVDGVLALKGKELTVHAIAQIYANICVAVVVVIGLVIKACAAVKTDVLVNLVVDISLALAACITLGAQLAVGLVAELRPFIECVVTIIVDLKLEALIKVFQIVVKA